jgi:hypothetical protein
MPLIQVCSTYLIHIAMPMRRDMCSSSVSKYLDVCDTHAYVISNKSEFSHCHNSSVLHHCGPFRDCASAIL